MPLNALVNVSIGATLTKATNIGAATGSTLQALRALATADGTGAGQADRIFSDRRTLAASAAEDLDLAGVLTDVYGATITFARIKALYIAADPGNTNNVIVGNAATNGFISWVGAAAHTVTVRPGGALLLVVGPGDATGYTVTAATADLLHVANSGAGTGVTYDVVLIGASA